MNYQRFQKLVRKNRQKVRENYGVEMLEMSVRVEAGRPKITIRPAS